MKVLILSCNTGGGHNAAGAAIAQALEKRGHTAVLTDFLSLAGEKVSKAVCGTYIGMVKNVPLVFGVTYGMGRAVSNADRALGVRSPVYIACAQVADKLKDYLDQNDFDAVIAPHTFPALALTELSKRGERCPLTVAVATDYTCTPFFEEEDCDYTMIPGKACIDEFKRRGFDEKKLVPLGIPVSADFLVRKGKEQCRDELGLSKNKKIVLIMGGSMGAGHIGLLLKFLLVGTGDDVQFAVICGSNKRLFRSLSHKFLGEKKIKIVGHTDKVARYMEACDLFYTKPGGITSTEGTVMGVPMVHMKPIPGCESRNRRLFVKNGMSISARSVLFQALRGIGLLNDPQKCAEMIAAQKKKGASRSAEKIVEFLENHMGE